jgi:D-arabinose 1-dehydrogenase-like Zn-dependent alcohol dehydrogenase
MLNDWAMPKMSDLGTKCAGHEGAGVIVKVGDQVKHLKPGMRAGFKVGPDATTLLQDLWY